MTREIVGWDTSKRSAKSSSVRLWRRFRRVIFRGLVQGEGWWSAAWLVPGDVAGEGCCEASELLVGERRLYDGFATVFSGLA